MAKEEEEEEEEHEDEPLDAARDEAASRSAPWWDAGGRAFSGIYWGGVALFVASLWRARSLPFVDYPQHLALAATLRRALTPGTPEALACETNLASYNSLFHVLVAALDFVMPIDAAGKVVLGGYFVIVAAATLMLLRAMGRPRARAFLVFTVIAGYSMAWGFVNFGLGVAIQLVVLARLLERPQRLARPASRPWRYDAVTAGVALLGAYTHLLGTAVVYMLMLVVIVVGVQTEKAPLMLRLGRAIRRGLPLLPALAYSGLIYWRQEHSAHVNYEYGSAEGNDDFALVKVKRFLQLSTGLRSDGLDAIVLGVGLGLLVLGAILRDPKDRRAPALRWMFTASAFAYVVIPHVFWATNFVFERISFLVVLTALLWAPRALPKYEWVLRFMFVSVGLAAGINFWTAMGAARVETEDLDAVIDAAPPERRMTGLIWYPKTASAGQWDMLHVPGYYVARKGGEAAYSFMRTMSLPIHYRVESMPPQPPTNFEFRPGEYDPDAGYARYFDLVLVKTTYDDGKDPRDSIWDERAPFVDVLAHRGRWWLLEANRVPHP